MVSKMDLKKEDLESKEKRSFIVSNEIELNRFEKKRESSFENNLSKLITSFSFCFIFLITLGFSLSFDDIAIYGRDEINGIASSITDVITVKINLSHDIARDGVFDSSLLKIDGRSLDVYGGSCIDIDQTGHKKTCSAEIGYYNSELCSGYIKVEYKTASRSVKICLDDVPPKVMNFDVSSSSKKPQGNYYNSEEEVTFIYYVQDYSQGNNICSGLNKLIFELTDNIKYEYEIPDKSCQKNGEISISLSEFGIGSNSQISQICLVAEDLIGYKSDKKCIPFVIDDQEPNIDTNSFRLLNSQSNTDLNNYLEEKKNYKVRPLINVTDNSRMLNPAQGIFKLKEDGQVIKSFNKRVACSFKRTTSEGLNLFECDFGEIQFSLNNGEKSYELEYAINISDYSGRMASESGNYELFVDKSSPSFVDVVSLKSVSGKSLSKNSTIKMTLNEEGCGLNNQNVYITSYAFGTKKADECVNLGYDWECYFYNINPSQSYHGQEVSVEVTSDTKDDCNNFISNVDGDLFFVDLEDPIVGEVNITNQNNELFVKDGDTLRISYPVSDDSEDVYIEANFSEILENWDNYKNPCQKTTGNNFTCELSISGVKPFSGNLNIRIFDDANNSIVKTERINIFRRDENAFNDYWTTDNVMIYPNLIDRTTIDKTDLYLFADFDLIPRFDEYSLVSLELYDCYSEDINLDYELMFIPDEISGRKQISLKFKIPQGSAIDVANTEINCSFGVKTFTGRTVTVNEEKENVIISVNFYDGFFSESTDPDKLKEKMDSLAKSLETYNKFTRHVISVVEGAETLANGIELFRYIAESFNLFAQVPMPASTGVVVDEIASTLGKTYSGVLETIGNFLYRSLTCNDGKILTPQGYQESDECGYLKERLGMDFIVEKFEQNVNLNQDLGLNFGCPDPKENLILSLTMMPPCIPGVTNTIQDYTFVKAAQLECYMNAIEYGTPVYVCDQMMSEYVCELTLGDIFEVYSQSTYTLPKLANALEGIIQDPISIALSAYSITSTPFVFITLSNAINEVFSGYESIVSLIHSGQNIMNMYSDEYYPTRVLNDYNARYGENK